MKKFLLIAAAAIGMVGCSNEDLVIEEAASTPITLKAVTKKASRGGLDDNSLTIGTKIFCTGLLHSEGTSTILFNNEPFTTTDCNVWQNNSVTWPIDGNMDFWGYTCTAYTKKLGTNDANESYTYYESADYAYALTPAITKKANGDFDTMTLDFGNTLEGHNDVMVSNIVNIECATKGSAKLTFSHALAWLVVNVYSTAADDFMKIYSIKVNNVKVSGSLKATNTANGVTCAWTPYKNDADGPDATNTLNFPAYGADSEAVLLGEAKNYTLSGLMVLPDQDQTSITITYAYKGDNNYGTKSTHTINLQGLKDLKNEEHSKWEAGKKYTYTIKISSDNLITLGASVNSFEEYNYETQL